MTEDLFNKELDLLPNYQDSQSPFDQAIAKKIEKLRREAEETKKRTWRYYQALKETDPRKYWAPKTQTQMHRDSEALGKEFEDGDFDE